MAFRQTKRLRFDPKVLARYGMKRLIGKGAFSQVYLAQDYKTLKPVAVKIIDKKFLQNAGLSVKDEVDILFRLSHDNIVKLYDTFENESQMYLIMEYVQGGELFSRLEEQGEFQEEEARHIMRQLLRAVGYLHKRGIVHRDLKPENILFKPKTSQVLLTDFGTATVPGDSPMTQPAGTGGYASPEELNMQPYTSKADCWSLGVIAYILLAGYPPFPFDNNKKMFECIKQAKYQFDCQFWDHISQEAKDFVSSLMTADPEKRLSCQQALRHPWILGRKVLTENQKEMLRSKLRAAFNATRWIIRTRKCIATDNNREIESPEIGRKCSEHALEKFSSELSEKESVCSLTFSLEGEEYLFTDIDSEEEAIIA